MRDTSPEFRGARFAEDESEPLAPPPSNAMIAYRGIRRRIMDNVYPIRATVSMQETATSLHMSRTPIRDALIRLEEERLVKLVPRHGFQVLPISARDTAEIYRILTSLEVLAIEQVMETNLSPNQLAELDAGVAGLEHTLVIEDREAWARFDAIFYETLIALPRNKRLVKLVRQFQDQTRRAWRITLHLRSSPELPRRISVKSWKQSSRGIQRGHARSTKHSGCAARAN